MNEPNLEHARLFFVRVEPKHTLGRILNADEGAIRELAAGFEEELERAPHVRFLQVDLLREILRLVGLRVQDGVQVRITRVNTRHETELDLLGADERRHSSPLRKLVRVVLKLVRNHSTSLGLNLEAPVNTSHLRVKLVESLDEGGDTLTLIHTLGFAHGVQLASADELGVTIHVPLAVLVRDRVRVIFREEGHRLTELVGSLFGSERLLDVRTVDASAFLRNDR